jgi:hypothetical protein
MLNPLGFLVFVRNLSLTNSRGFFIPNGIISFYFNDLSISGWALASAHPEIGLFARIPAAVIKPG